MTKETSKKHDPLALIFLVFIAWFVVDNLSQSYPNFSSYGWGLFLAFSGGAIFYLRRTYWK